MVFSFKIQFACEKKDEIVSQMRVSMNRNERGKSTVIFYFSSLDDLFAYCIRSAGCVKRDSLAMRFRASRFRTRAFSLV